MVRVCQIDELHLSSTFKLGNLIEVKDFFLKGPKLKKLQIQECS